MHKKLLLLMILGIFFLSFVSSVPPVQSTIVAPEGLEIEATNFEYLQQNVYHVFRFRVYNATNDVYLDDDDVNCSFGIVNSQGEFIFNQPAVTSSEYIFSVNVTVANFSKLGIYHVGINCITNDGTTAGGVKTLSFEVTTNGEGITTGKSIFYIGLLFTLLFFFGVAVYFFTDTENIIGKVGSLGMGYLLLIAITFVSWNMASDFFTSATFLVGMMKTLFYVFLVGLFPLIIGLFIWYFLMLFKIKEIQRLMDKGFSFDDAKRRTGGKYK